MNEENIRIEDIIDAIKSRWQMIVSLTLIATIIAVIVSFFFIKPKYEASTKLFIGKETSSENKYSSSDVQMYQSLLKTYVDVIKTDDLISSAVDNKNINKTSEQIKSSLSVEAVANTQIIKISYVSNDKNECKSVVENIANTFVNKSSELISNANVQIVESVRLPEKPVSPNKKLNIAIAAFIGLAVGIGIALLQEFLNNTFKEKEQVEALLGVPVIGTIPNEQKM
ncbi:MAG: Wzz/FepE/Etk N-terminal domain-containing protein [Clostridiaceae bacterium]|nr:Wzz/FepE/Etk N-terminal domain-containing protein [Clostridiaceae bacterium]